MKGIFPLALFLLFPFCMKAQEVNVHITSKDSTKRNVDIHVRKKLNPATIVGITLVSTGPVVGVIGLATIIHEGRKTYSPGRPQPHNGPIIVGTGITMTVAGAGLCVLGYFLDKKKARKASLSIIAPKNNEIGIAYTF